MTTDIYKGFILERHRIWERRIAGEPGPWSEDPILIGRKFCNAFRVLDHGSQYVLKHLLDGPPIDVLLRCFLYRFTNRSGPWEHFYSLYERVPTLEDLTTDLLLSTWDRYESPIFNNAYRINVDRTWDGKKLDWLIFRAKEIFLEGKYFSVDEYLVSDPPEQHELLTRVPRVGDFMAMQILTDWNYSRYGYDAENEFIVPGPGAVRGSEILDPDADPTEMIYRIAEVWEAEPDAPRIPLPGGGSRGLSLMDIQNTFCEFDKYIREQVRGKTFSPYTPTHKTTAPALPEHWKGTDDYV